jgi:hypothetical protein
VLLTVRPYEEAVRITSTQSFTGGKLSVLVQSGAVMPGIITSIYLASGNGRHGDAATGTQDEIDLEWKGNAPTMVQTNVFLSGQEDLQVCIVCQYALLRPAGSPCRDLWLGRARARAHGSSLSCEVHGVIYGDCWTD